MSDLPPPLPTRLDEAPAATGGARSWKRILIVLAGVVLVLGLLGVVFADQIHAYAAVASAEQQLEAIGLPPEEHEKAMAAVREYAEDVRSGRLTAGQRKAIAAELGQPALAVIVSLTAFKYRILPAAKLPAADEARLQRLLGRFAEGVRRTAIQPERLRDAAVHLAPPQPTEGAPAAESGAAPEISPARLTAFADSLAAAVDHAKIEDQDFPLDLPGALRAAIERGRTASAEAHQ